MPAESALPQHSGGGRARGLYCGRHSAEVVFNPKRRNFLVMFQLGELDSAAPPASHAFALTPIRNCHCCVAQQTRQRTQSVDDANRHRAWLPRTQKVV